MTQTHTPTLLALGVAMACWLAPAALAQRASSQEQLTKLRDEKMALEVFKKAPWTFDFAKARSEAKKSGKPIFTYFSRSFAH